MSEPVRLTIELPAELFEWAREEAASEGLSIADYVVKELIDWKLFQDCMDAGNAAAEVQPGALPWTK